MPPRRRSAERAHVRLLIEPYRNDRAGATALEAFFAALHSVLGPRRRVALEIHLDRRRDGSPLVWFAALCRPTLAAQLQAALRIGYPNARLRALGSNVDAPPVAIRLRRQAPPRAEEEPVEVAASIEPLLLAMSAAGAPATVRLHLRPASRALEHLCSKPQLAIGPLWWASPVVLARDRAAAAAIASALSRGRPRLVCGRTRRGDPGLARSPLSLHRPRDLAALWSLPAPEFTQLPCPRRAVPLAPAPPGIARCAEGGLLRDEHGSVTIAIPQRRQHVAVVGAVDQGKSSFLVASAREDLRREDCALIVLDPKGDAARAVISIVPADRTLTVLDMAAPSAGFNPLAVAASPDAIADQVVAALRGLFGDGEVRGSSDRYLRNAVIAALAYAGPAATLWDAARLLEVGEEGRAFRAAVAERLVELPSYAELATFFARELPAQLADARATTTAKLDAPANKLARVLNSPAVKRVLLNDTLRIDLDGMIERAEVLVVRGALGEIGAGNVAVLMQLLLGMLDAALSRIQDRRAASGRRAVALKVDEAPLAINTAFAQTLALKRSAGLEVVACWQADAQWEPPLRSQLDALFAHRVLFASASADDARSGSALLMSDYSDQIRAGDEQVATLASPDVRLHLPRHTALASWTTGGGRERPFLARTLPLPLDPARIDWHARDQQARGARELTEPAPPPPATALAAAQPSSASAAEPPAGGVRPPAASAAEAWGAAAASRSVSAVETAAAAAASRSVSAVETRAGVAPGRPVSAVETAAVAARSRPALAVETAAAGAQSRPALAMETSASGVQSPNATAQSPPADADEATPASYAELVALDAAARMRTLPSPMRAQRIHLAPPDLELLTWLAAAGYAMTSQIHRRLHAGRSLTVTQRQLKRLADAGLLTRVQFHRADGGGIPHCCAVSAAALELLGAGTRRAPVMRAGELPRLRGHLHLNAWLLALEARLEDGVREVLGPGRAAIVPRLEGPAQLELGPGLIPRDFMASRADGSRAPLERFAPVRPSAIVSLRADGRRDSGDVLIAQDPGEGAEAVALLEAYDHLLAGWWRAVARYRRAGAPPAVVFVCAGEERTGALARAADGLLSAAEACIGMSPASWPRPGRERIGFVAEEWLHRGSLRSWRVPALPPAVRGGASEHLREGDFAAPARRLGGDSAKPPWR